MKKVLIYGINYAPELTGIGKYTGELGAWLAETGHEVEVITTFPYYPQWEVQTDFKGKLWHTHLLKGVTVHRCPFYVPKQVSAAKRIIHEFSFLLSSLVYWIPLLFKPKADVVLCVAPPFHLSFVAYLYSLLKGSLFYIHVQDLQVDAAKDLGMIKNKSLLNVLFKAEKFILNKADRVSTISLAMEKKIIQKEVGENKTYVFPNWVDMETIQPLPKSASLRKEFGLRNTDKVILYAGNLGEKQGLELIIEAAKHYQKFPHIYFVVVGSGGAKERLIEKVDADKLTNVKFFPLQKSEDMSRLLATADLHLVLQKKAAADLLLPSKLGPILAAGGCVLVTADPGTTLHNLVDINQLGLVVEPESLPALVAGIDMALKTNLAFFQANARSYAKRHLSKKVILSAMERELLGGKLVKSVPEVSTSFQPLNEVYYSG